MAAAVNDLAKELLEMEATGDRQRVESWFGKYDKMSDEMKTALQKKTADIPVDVDPVYSFKKVVK
jgi:1-aminocyclopropane-1-carboxylate deaminase/D-cysteine desulfhydrase-like pyridoxal-dependent ACC family enzyme